MLKKTKSVILMLPLLLTLGLSSCAGGTGPQGIQGEQGEKGDTGADGRSVTSIEKTSSDGLVDTYTITYSDGTTSTFTVTNGQNGTDGSDGKDGMNGEQGIQGEPGQDGHTPAITIGTNGNWYVDGVDTGIAATGSKGDKGDTGETGAQGEKGDKGDKGDTGEAGKDGENAPHYGEILTVTYYLNGGSFADDWVNENKIVSGDTATEKVTWGDTLDLPTPSKSGYVFDGWVTGYKSDDSKFSSKDAVFHDLNLYATYSEDIPEVYTLNYVVEERIVHKDYFTSAEPLTDLYSDSQYLGWYSDQTMTTKVKSTTSLRVENSNAYFYGSFNYDGSYIFKYISDTDTYEIFSYSNKNSKSKVVVPKIYNGKQVTSIGSGCFKSCSLTGIEIHDGITSIGSSAFSGCSYLTEIKIPDSVSRLESYLFSSCVRLTSVSIPNTIEYVDAYAFDGCSALPYNAYENAYYLGNEENPYLVLIKAKNTNISSCEINDGSRILLQYSFKDCSLLNEISIPSNVVYINEDSFVGCVSLSAINVEEENTIYTSIDGLLVDKNKSLGLHR